MSEAIEGLAKRQAPDLQNDEAEVIIRLSRTGKMCVHSFIPCITRHILKLDESEIVHLNTSEGLFESLEQAERANVEIYGVKAYLPLGYLKLSGKGRSSNASHRVAGKVPSQ